MKFQPDRLDGVNTITRHDGHTVWVNAAAHERAALIPWAGAVQAWRPAHVDDLLEADFDAVLALKPELVIFGSGARLRFVAPALYRGLMNRGIGMETMDTAAACRTFNVLVSEGRAVVAALLIGPHPMPNPAQTPRGPERL